MLKHLGAALGPGGSSYRAQRRGCGRGLHRSCGPGEMWGPAAPRQQEEGQPLSPASPSSVVGISHWLSSAVTQRQEASSHEPPGAEKQVGNGGWLDLGGGRQVDNGQHRCRDPHVPGHPRFCSLRGLPGLGLRKLESVDQGVPGLASPSPRQAAPCPRGMCGWAGSSASG